MSEDNAIKYLSTAGTFEGVVADPGEGGWFQEMGEKSTPCIRIPVVVVEDGFEKTAIWRGWLTEKAMDNTIRTLAKVFGFNGDLDALANGKESFAGKPCQIVTEIETYEGKDRLRIKWINPAGASAPTMDAEKVQSIISKLTSRAKAVAKAELAEQGKPVASAKPAPKKDVEKDDIPY